MLFSVLSHYYPPVNSKETRTATSKSPAPQIIPTEIDQNKNTKSNGSLIAARKRTIVNATDCELDKAILDVTQKYTKSYVVKTHNITKSGIEMIIELRSKNGQELVKEIKTPGFFSAEICSFCSKKSKSSTIGIPNILSLTLPIGAENEFFLCATQDAYWNKKQEAIREGYAFEVWLVGEESYYKLNLVPFALFPDWPHRTVPKSVVRFFL